MATQHSFSVLANSCVRPPIDPDTGLARTSLDALKTRRIPAGADDSASAELTVDPSSTGTHQPGKLYAAQCSCSWIPAT